MASRQEEKEARRRERTEREQAAARSADRRRRLQLVFGGVLAVALVAVVVVAVAVGFGGGDDEQEAGGATAATTLPEQKISDLKEAADAAGCELINPRYEGNGHEDKTFKSSDYKTNPPTSGAHAVSWYQDGVYEPGTTPDLGQLVHTLEHGRIDVQYKPGTPATTVTQLEQLLAEQDDGYHMVLFENTTDMSYAVAATAWTHLLSCEKMNPQVFDAIRAFRTRYVDKGPEAVP